MTSQPEKVSHTKRFLASEEMRVEQRFLQLGGRKMDGENKIDAFGGVFSVFVVL